MKTESLFVLRVVKYGEADLIVSGLSAMGAKVPLFAKAALKSCKRFGGGVLQPTHYIQATYGNTAKSFRGHAGINQQDSVAGNMKNATSDLVAHHSKMYYLKEACLKNDFYKIRQDYERLQLGLYMLQLVDQFCKEGLLDNAQVFHLLGNALTTLETSQNLQLLQMVFELRLLKIQGVLEEDRFMEKIFSQSVLNHEELKLASFEESHIKASIKKHLQTHLLF